ncbi:methyltransferase [Lentisphaera araneosa HTCC2155]|uniref:Methyltransferase n=1 Tax=Lentisphaera araneosa HTCC2155 TaxID=313628 RepID=A6DTE0_9BACT|nr:MGMT family protein [Lentisphaera araneosa]EDM25120.1 methyltransferase [Lentisphaera araneosa HTCC2155]
MAKNKQQLIDEMSQAQLQGKISAFRLSVLKQLLEIPRGRVSTYANLAKSINCRSSQAIGQALKANPWAPDVPCHRIIKSDFSIGGFFGQGSGEQITKKLNLLKNEGVFFDIQGKINEEKLIFNFDKDKS